MVTNSAFGKIFLPFVRILACFIGTYNFTRINEISPKSIHISYPPRIFVYFSSKWYNSTVMASDDKQKAVDGLSKKRVLLVEDDVFLSDIIARKLVAQGCVFLYAQDGEKALPLVEREVPDIILLDIMLPGINGFDLLKKFKENPKTKDIPVIILSNLSQPSDIEKGKSLKAARFLIKATTSTDGIMLKLKEVLEEKKKSK